MAIRNIVPRNNNEGQLGTENKKWNKIYTNEIFATNFTGNLTGTADNAIKDNKNQQIDATYIKNISINNDTLTVTKGNDDSQNIVVNNISHAISSDNATNASKLQGLTTGNANGQIPINNGTENTNLNAALLNGKASSYFATNNHTHTTATQSSNGYMSNVDKKKLDGIASGAEVNQNAFANVKVGSTTIQSDAKQDTLELAAGANISLVGDANNDKVTIGVTGKVASASKADSATNATNATKATQDKNGLQIDTNYLKRSGGTMSGALNLANNILNAVGDDCYFGDQNVAGGFCLKGVNGTTNLTLINKDNVAQKASLSYAGGNLISSATIQGNLSGSATKATQDSAGQTINTTYVKGVTANNATLTITKGNGSTSTTTINNVSNATNANNLVISGTSAHIKYGGGDVDENTAISQNKVNLLIGSWYSTGFRDLCSSGTPIRVAINHRTGNIKTTGAVTASGGFRGNLTGNATSATKATQDKNGLQIDTNYLKRSGGTITGQLTMGTGTEVQIKAPNNTGFYFNSGALGCYNWSGTNGGSIFAYSPSSNTFTFGKAVTAPTPGTSDNSTRVATTAFVQSLINSLKGSIGGGTIVASNLAQNGWVKFSNGFIVQWGRGARSYCTFPIAFPNACFTAIGMLVSDFESEVTMRQPSKTGVQFHSRNEYPWNWIAVGN